MGCLRCAGAGVGGGGRVLGGRLGLYHVRILVSKSEGNGFFFSFK